MRRIEWGMSPTTVFNLYSRTPHSPSAEAEETMAGEGQPGLATADRAEILPLKTEFF